jgi:hypothetical protein
MARTLGQQHPDRHPRLGAELCAGWVPGLAGYTYSLLSSISERDLREWDPFARPGDAAMDPRFLATLERSMGSGAKFWNVVFHGPAGQPAAAAVLSLFPIDGLLFVQEPWKKWVQALRQRFPNFLRVKVLFCGCPVSAGQSHLRFARGSDRGAVMRLLDRLMLRMARAEGTPFLVFKEFDEEEVGRCDELTALGYVRVDSLPMNGFPTRFRDFDDVMASLRGPIAPRSSGRRRNFNSPGCASSTSEAPSRSTHCSPRRCTDFTCRSWSGRRSSWSACRRSSSAS